jgi:hypothetical protein
MGGLGNQMFQYAFGKSLSIKHNKKLILDISLLENLKKNPNITPRDFELNAFGIKPNLTIFNKVHLFYLKYIKHSLCYINENDPYGFCQGLSLTANNTYIITGYFQSYKYFNEFIPFIVSDFKFKMLSEVYHKLQDFILGITNSVSVLIRRDDFVLINEENVLQENYYINAFKYIKSKVANPTFVIFTIGDTGWTHEKFSKFNDCVVIENEKPNLFGFEKLYLMTLCNHSIIANSSYGWWGGFLNHNSNKIVVAPSKWDSDIAVNSVIIKNRIPTDWVLI